MILTETNLLFPLSSVKPLEKFDSYRKFLLEETAACLKEGRVKRTTSPVTGGALEQAGSIDGLPYVRCAETGSLFLETVGENKNWKELLGKAASERQNPAHFHKEIASSRTSNKYQPKLEWIENVLRLQGLDKPSILEVTTPPNRFSTLMKSSPLIEKVDIVNEMDLLETGKSGGGYDVAVLFESLDRVNDPARLFTAVVQALKPGGLLFVTALVSSGFDVLTLGLKNHYLVPPDRTNCFSFSALKKLFEKENLPILEASTPGVLDVEIVAEHARKGQAPDLSDFEKTIIAAGEEEKAGFQSFLQQSGLSSFARFVGRKNVKK